MSLDIQSCQKAKKLSKTIYDCVKRIQINLKRLPLAKDGNGMNMKNNCRGPKHTEDV